MSNLLRVIGKRLIALPIMVLGVVLLVFIVMSFSPRDPAIRPWASRLLPRPSRSIVRQMVSTRHCWSGTDGS